MLNNIDWTTYPNLDVDSCWDFLLDKILNILDTVCPEKNLSLPKIDQVGLQMILLTL